MKYRKGISAIIINSQRKILLVNLTSFEHHFYAIPGGGIDEGETLEEAVYREIQEELGIDPEYLNIEKKATSSVKFDFKSGPLVRNGIKYKGQERRFFLVRFMGEDKDIHPNPEEVRKYTWSTYTDLRIYLLFAGQLQTTQEMIRELCPEITL